MPPSRTFVEQTAGDAVESRGEDMDLSTSSEVSADDVTEAAGKRSSKAVDPAAHKVEIDAARDELLTEFGKETLRDRYLLPGETYQDLFARVASAYADDADHAQRVYDYI